MAHRHHRGRLGQLDRKFVDHRLKHLAIVPFDQPFHELPNRHHRVRRVPAVREDRSDGVPHRLADDPERVAEAEVGRNARTCLCSGPLLTPSAD